MMVLGLEIIFVVSQVKLFVIRSSSLLEGGFLRRHCKAQQLIEALSSLQTIAPICFARAL